MKKLSNITIAQYKTFLTKAGCKYIRTKGGHEHWYGAGITRPITFQTHIEPIPEFIIKNALRSLGMDKKKFFELLES